LRLDEQNVASLFRRPQNIGILLGEPSIWLIDIDIDAPDAAGLADRFLPSTHAIFGRAGKQRSHWLYRAERPVTTAKFAEPMDGAMLVELRSSGCQTVFPGSIHPGGETIQWDTAGEPRSIAPDVLMLAVGIFAGALLVRRHATELHKDACEPSYPPPTGNVEEARAKLEAIATAHLDAVFSHRAAEAKYRESLNQTAVRQARSG
jgi:hypothetical protein